VAVIFAHDEGVTLQKVTMIMIMMMMMMMMMMTGTGVQ
jgi:hypothetical protein